MSWCQIDATVACGGLAACASMSSFNESSLSQVTDPHLAARLPLAVHAEAAGDPGSIFGRRDVVPGCNS